MGEQMTFPATFEEFAEQYKIIDKEQIYTNGTELIPIFRVKQWLEHKDNKAEEFFWEIDKLLTMIYTDDEDGRKFIGVDMAKYYALKMKYAEDKTE